MIENHQRYKSLQQSEERNLKTREKKLIKKAKTLDECQAKIDTKKKVLNEKENFWCKLIHL